MTPPVRATSATRKRVEVHSDGACLGNPGPGGYGVVLRYNGHEKELSGGFRRTTNNRMELLGAIVGLEQLSEPCAVDLHSDSTYVVKAMREGWTEAWIARGWRTSDKKPVANQDLWVRLLAAAERHEVSWHWVRGHAGHVDNERCDALANAAAAGRDLPVDTGYERELE